MKQKHEEVSESGESDNYKSHNGSVLNNSRYNNYGNSSDEEVTPRPQKNVIKFRYELRGKCIIDFDFRLL